MTHQPSYRVRIHPDDVSVRVEHGATILDALRAAGVQVNSICGGDGICGKCKVVLKSGQVNGPPTTLLSRDEVLQQCVLACTSRILSDIEVFVPAETRVQTAQILVDEDAERFQALTSLWAQEDFAFDPLVRKLFLKMAAPTMEDPLPDHERVYAAIRRAMPDCGELQTGFSVLQGLPGVLQGAEYQVTVTLGRRGAVTELVQVEPGDTTAQCCGLAVDVGTTTVVALLVDLNTGRVISSEARYNSQMPYGADYIARIMYARQNDALTLMQRTVVGDINQLIDIMTQRTGIHHQSIVGVLCSGNTAMIHMLLGLDPSRIQRAPYVPSANHIPPIRAAQVGIHVNGRGLLYTLPSVGAYVGSDVTAGVTAIRFDHIADLSLYIDIGTNGEVVLGNREWMVCCSASAGPAFEGSGIRHGMRASRGAVERVTIDRSGRCSVRVIGDVPPRGLCGSGLLDSLAQMLRAGILDRRGTLIAGAPGVRQGEGGLEYVVVPQADTAIGADLVITQNDIRSLIHSKAAIYAAIRVLLQSLDLKPEMIQRIFLAGGFGNYLDVHNAVTIGMLPDIAADQIYFVGNGSLSGGKMALLSRAAQETCDRLASQMTYFDLMQNARFMEEFVAANFLPHTHVEQFPSVLKELPL